MMSRKAETSVNKPDIDQIQKLVSTLKALREEEKIFETGDKKAAQSEKLQGAPKFSRLTRLGKVTVYYLAQAMLFDTSHHAFDVSTPSEVSELIEVAEQFVSHMKRI